jgi:hypothetical protein
MLGGHRQVVLLSTIRLTRLEKTLGKFALEHEALPQSANTIREYASERLQPKVDGRIAAGYRGA